MNDQPSTPAQETEPEPVGIKRIFAHVFFGVFLPAFTLGFELVTGFSDEIYINPVPSLLHAIIVGLVPLINAIILFRCARGQWTRPWELHLNSLSISISLVYALVYLPISPFAIIGIIAYGLGFLPLSPLIALFCSYRLRKQLKRNADESINLGWRHFLVGLSLGFFLLALASAHLAVTDYALSQYARADQAGKNGAIKLLRRFGSEDVLLRACYQRARPVFFWGGGSSLDTTEARQLYYRVTGKSFNESRADKNTFFTMRGDSFDRDLGGEHVGQRIDDLHLRESRLDGILSPESGVGYVEWTMVLQNEAERREHEARMLLSMPKGAVASRVTLWVNGEPREAAFASKAKVRAAYQSVAVRQRRDPILVNWAGPDLLLVQCFPIQPNGGEMKIRVGMSFPLEVDSNNNLSYRYPAIVAENFNISEDLRHSKWYEEQVGGEVSGYPLINLSSEQLHSEVGQVRSKADLINARFISSHPTKETELTLAATTEHPIEAARPDVVVIDGSLKMRSNAEPIARWLESQKTTLSIYLASDEVKHFEAEGSDAAKWLRAQKFAGGQDNVPALIEAIGELQPSATKAEPKRIFWFSGPQPVQLSGTERIKQYYERRALPVEIVACLSTRDYNALYELAPLSYSDHLYFNDAGELENPIVRFEETERPKANAQNGSRHAHRIWLAEQTRKEASEVYQRQAAMRPGSFKKAIADLANKAAEAYLVTQVSGAVVLETDRQYKENDLEAGDPNHVPSVPEFRQFALIMGIMSFSWILVSRRRYARRA